MGAPSLRAISLAVLAVPLGIGCSDDGAPERPIATLPPEPWIAGATLGSGSFEIDFTDETLDRMLDELAAEDVSAVVGHSPVSRGYRTDAELERDLALARRVAHLGHVRGMRVLWSMPSLDQSADVARWAPPSPIAREHPEWLQLPADAPDSDGRVRLCPVGPARDWLLERVRRFATSGVDAVLVAAPELAPLRGREPFGCPELHARFEAETGMRVPPRVPCDDRWESPPGACAAVWADPAWRAFVRFRHGVLAGLEAALADAARAVSPDVVVVVRHRALDTNLATDTGSDPSFGLDTPGLFRLWDVPSTSTTEGMLRAGSDDWLHRLAMLKYGRGVDRDQASLATSAGIAAWDAGLALATALAAGASPWEHRAGAPEATAGQGVRARAFAWARAHGRALASARSGARVAVLQSSASRDVVDFGAGTGTFSTSLPPRARDAAGWWADGPEDGAGALEVVGEARGVVKALTHLHVPFDVLPAERVESPDLARYRLVLAPDVVAVSDRTATALRAFVAGGGRLLSTGLDAFSRDERGEERPELALADLFGTSRGTPRVADAVASKTATHVEALLGRRYLRYGDALALDRFRSAVEAAGASPLVTDAPADVYLDLREGDGEVQLVAVSLSGAERDRSERRTEPRRFAVAVAVPAEVDRVTLTSPDEGAADGELAFASPHPGVVAFEVSVAQLAVARIHLGTRPVVHDVRVEEPAPVIASLREHSGLAGHSVLVRGAGFGHEAGAVRWGDEPCLVTAWRPDAISCTLPDGAAPQTAAIAVEVAGEVSNTVPFRVVAPAYAPTPEMQQALAFLRGKMRSPLGGIFTNFKDRADEPSSDIVYPYGHHQTSEHLGLLLWVAAAMHDHAAFEEAYRFLVERMISPRRDVVNWAIDKRTGAPMVAADYPGAPLLHSNAPLDDFRVVKGLVAGWEQWKDPRYHWTALRVGHALLETSTTRAARLPEYPEGIVAYAYNWLERAGTGATDYQVVPIDYADLWAMRWLAERDARWRPILEANVRLMERAALPSGQFLNSYLPDTRALSGDFEYRDTIAGQKVKTVQSLWIAIHLARVGRTGAARRALDFYAKIYAERGRIAEYLNVDGTECTEPELAGTLHQGEARIYAQLARLASYLGEDAFADALVREKILPDQVTDAASPLLGSIGKSTTDEDDAEAWNTLESLVTLAMLRGSPVVRHVWR